MLKTSNLGWIGRLCHEKRLGLVKESSLLVDGSGLKEGR